MDTQSIKTEIVRHSFFTNQLKSLIESLLIANEIKYHIIEARTKNAESLSEKIDRKQIQNINEITDLSGLRIIVYYQDDIDKVEKIIRQNFLIDEPNSINKSELYKSNEFGYLSVHYIVSLNNDRENLTEWKNFANLKAEIQVRTVLQHSWASISHELYYKKNYEIPKEIERKLYRLAGLFELADEQFLDIRDYHAKIFKDLKESDVNNLFEKEKINLITLTYLFEKENHLEIFDYIYDTAIKSGFEDDYFPSSKRFLSEIVRISKTLKIETIEELNKVLIKNKNLYSEYFTHLFIENGSQNWYGDLEFFVGLALMLDFNSKQANEYEEIGNSWGKNVLNQVLTTIKKIKKL